MSLQQKYLLIITGPTGVGKTDLSIGLAEELEAEIFSCDSRQVYKELNIGVAKPAAWQLQKIKHHFIGTTSIYQHYSISQYETEAITQLTDYFTTHNVAVMCGGSGLYIDAVCNGVDTMPDHDENIRREVNALYKEAGIERLRFELKHIDPDYYATVDLKNPQRLIRAIEVYRSTGIPFSKFRTNKKRQRNFKIIKIGIHTDRQILYDNINKRTEKMMDLGLLHEAETLLPYRDLTALKTIGYRELFNFLEGKIDLENAVNQIKQHTRNYARRQLTWFRQYDDIQWFKPSDYDYLIKYLKNVL